MLDTASEQRFAKTLTEQQQRLWNLLRGGAARDIGVLAKAIGADVPVGGKRYQQQRVASHVSRMNGKLPRGFKIAPGEPRFTYQLQRNA